MASGARNAVITLLDVLLCVAVMVCWPLRWLRLLTARGAKLSVWTGAPIINMAVNAKAERSLGARAITVVPYTYFVTSRFDYNLQSIVAGRYFGVLLRYGACLGICLFADRVHAYVDGGILPQKRHRTFNRTELRLYRLMRLPVFAWTYGADVRVRSTTRGLGAPNCCTDCTKVMQACVCSAEIADVNYQFVRRHCAAVFAMGDMLEYTPGSRNDLYFWPVDLDEDEGRKYRPVFPEACASRPLRVVHAPNHREFKGTRYIEEAVAQLRAEGVPIELVLVERVPNSQALEIYRGADLVLDQVMVGYHGYFALEAMALGKPVMVFIRHRTRYLLKPDECPLVDVTLSGLKESLREWAVGDRERLAAIGRAGRKYVEDNYTLEAFARRLERAYQELGVTA